MFSVSGDVVQLEFSIDPSSGSSHVDSLQCSEQAGMYDQEYA